MSNFGIPFYKIYGFFFKTFKIDSDTKMVEELRKRKIPHAMIIKRSWIFAVFISWVLFLTFAISGLNVYNTINIMGLESISGWVIVSFLVISCILLLKASIQYIYSFAKTYGRSNDIVPLEKLIEELNAGDEKFKTFFNQISLNIMLFYILIIFNLFHIGFNIFFAKTDFTNIAYGVFDIVCLFGQIYTMHYYRKKMIDLEMDFNVVAPGEILFVNQSNMLSSQQTLNSEKIKTIKSSSTNFIASFFNIGNINVLTEGDQGALGVMDMYYVDSPGETVKNMKNLVNETIVIVKNEYLLQILKHLKIKDIEYDSPENIDKLKAFLKENDADVKSDYERGDIIQKENIEDIYKNILTMKGTAI